MRIPLALIALLLSANLHAADPAAAPDPWAQVRFLIGRWSGSAAGEPGHGTVKRTYEFALKNRFIHERNVSTYPPQERNKQGEVHEHWGFISYDRARKCLVLRQFHQEGFVNQYVLNAVASSPQKLVFDSERFENLDERFKARETYEILGADEFTETFEIAEPGKDYAVYSKNHFRRE